MNHNGGILQTPDFFMQKSILAESRVGAHMLLAIPFENGVVFGMRFDARRNRKVQWIKPVTQFLLVAGWGEYADFMAISQFLDDSAQSMEEFVGEDYVTLPCISKIVSPFIKQKFENSVPFVLDILLIDVLTRQMCLIDLQGNIMLLEHFGVLGGYHYMKEEPRENITREDFEKLIVFPRKSAIKFLSEVLENGKNRKSILNKTNATKILTQTLFSFDPSSKKETFEIVTYENQVFMSFIIERKKNKNKSP